jgi:hypothetical protein
MMVSKNVMWGILAVAAGAGVAAVLLPSARGRRSGQYRGQYGGQYGGQYRDQSTLVDEASEDSFPASDPPSFSAPVAAVPGPTS